MTGARAAGWSGRKRISDSALQHLTIYGLLLLFWVITLDALDRAPGVNEGEALIVSLGYKLVTDGSFGTDLFSGFQNMQQHFFLITPLMSLVQGANLLVAGMGLLQWRLPAALAGALTCALTFRLGSRLIGARAAVLAVVLLIGWQWARAGATVMALTGIPLMDVSRIVRHDILVAPLGLAAWAMFLRQRSTKGWRDMFLGGLLAGIAGLAHLYGLFWLAAFGSSLAVEWLWDRRTRVVGPMLVCLAGAALPWVPVAGFVLPNLSDFSTQAMQSRSRFDLLNPEFYISNVATEIHRYSLGWREARGLLNLGSWLVVLGVPAAWLWLAGRAKRQHDRRALWLLAPALVFPALFTLLIEPKTYNYLVAVAPVWALLLAWAATHLLVAHQRAVRVLATGGLVLSLAQGGLTLARVHGRAQAAHRPGDTFAQLRTLIPLDARVIGHQHYWPGLYDREFRSFGLPFFLAGTVVTATPATFRAALEEIDPEYVLLDPVMQRVFADTDLPEAAANTEQFWVFMREHEAQRLATLPIENGAVLEVFHLER